MDVPIIFKRECKCGRMVRLPAPHIDRFLETKTLRVRCRECGHIAHAQKIAASEQQPTNK